MNTTKMFRQGDLLFISIDRLPPFLKKLDHLVIAEGEATGHKHQIIGNTAVLFEPENSTTDRMSAGNMENSIKFLEVVTDSDIIHNEHRTITLPKGTYQVIQQREYSPNLKGGRYVLD